MIALIIAYTLVGIYAVCLVHAAAQLFKDWHSSRPDFTDFEDDLDL